ncbi:MAG: twin transmembrane helix small protein [Pseudomonadota bacterium]
MINDPFFFIVALACLAVVAILLFGVASFAKGGEFNRRNANRIMRYRLMAQALAVVLILLFVFFRRMGG